MEKLTLKKLAEYWKTATCGVSIVPNSSSLTYEQGKELAESILELYGRLERLEAIVLRKKELICEEWKPKKT